MELESIGTGRVSADYSLRESRELGRSVGAVGASRCVVYSLVVLLVDYWEARDHTNTRTESNTRYSYTVALQRARFLYSALQPTKPRTARPGSKYINLGHHRIWRK